MRYPLDKYDFYEHTLEDGTIETIAISSFAGKTVKGKSKCHPSDNYNPEVGRTLAALRCAEKITSKRLSHASEREKEAHEMVELAKLYERDMGDYRTDAAVAWCEAEDELKAYMKQVMGE